MGGGIKGSEIGLVQRLRTVSELTEATADDLGRQLDALRRDMANVLDLAEMVELIFLRLEDTRRITHAGIYLLIAGTYTPFMLVNLRGAWGWTLLTVIWSLALLGVLFQVSLLRSWQGLSLGLYIGMGWVVVVAIKPMLDAVAPGGLILLLLGGLAYTSGVVFYLWKSLSYHHAIWHGFVLAGSILHFFAVLFYVIPLA